MSYKMLLLCCTPHWVHRLGWNGCLTSQLLDDVGACVGRHGSERAIIMAVPAQVPR